MDFRRQMNDFFAQIYRQNELYDIWAKQNRMKPSTVAVLYLLDQFETAHRVGYRKYICCPSRQFTRWCRSWSRPVIWKR